MRIQLFDQFVVESQSGHVVRLRTKKIRGLCAYLAAHANQPILRSVLADFFWGDNPDKIAKRNLSNSLSRLKKTINIADEASGKGFVTTSQTIELHLGSHISVDVAHFNALWESCEKKPRSLWHADNEIISALTELIALYKGEFLTGLTLDNCIEFDTWVMLMREQLHQRVLTALETVAQHYTATNSFVSAEKYARQLLQLEPWHEAGHEQLIRIFRATRRPELAQKQFELCATILREELGVEPSAAIIDALQSGLPRQSVSQLESFKPPIVKTENRHNLSAEPNAFLGREREIAQLKQLLTDGRTRVVTLHGEGGIGKTRLARAVAVTLLDTFSQGVCFVSLASVNEPGDVVSAIIKAQGIQLVGSSPPFEQLCAALRDQKMLLIIDNLEHLIDEDGEVIDLLLDLHDAARQLTLLVTSRQQLWVRAETVMRLTELPYPDESVNGTWQQFAAVRLLTERLRQLDASFDPINNRESILTICRAVQGLPLGLELAAAQASVRSCAAIAAELGKGLSLRTRMRDVPKRQRSLEKVFDYSWQLLDEAVRPILARCAIIRGDFDYDAFHAITGGQRDELETLLSHALVRPMDAGRYDMHELVRQHAAAHLDATQREHTQNEHMHFFLGMVASYHESYFYEIETMVTHLRRDWTHVEQAWAWAVETESAELLCNAITVFSAFWTIGGLTASSRPMLTAAIERFKRKWFFDRNAKQTVDQLLATRLELDWQMGDFKALEGIANTVFYNWRTVHPHLEFMVVYLVGIYFAITDQVTQAFECLDALCEDDEVREHAYAWFQLSSSRMMLLADTQRLEEAQAVHDALEPLLAQGQAQVWAIKQRGWMRVFTWRLSEGLADYQRHYDWISRLRGGHVVDATLSMHIIALYRLGYFREAIAAVIEDEHAVASDFSDVYSIDGLFVVTQAFRRLGKLDRALHFGRISYQFDELVQSEAKEGRGSNAVATCVAYGLALCAAGQPIEAQKLLVSVRSDMNKGELTSNCYALIEGSLAHCYAESGQWHAAYEMVNERYETLISADGVYTHLEQTWFCYKILHHHADPRAADLLQHARNVLDFRIDRLALEHRERFVNSFPEHREILRLTNLFTDEFDAYTEFPTGLLSDDQ